MFMKVTISDDARAIIALYEKREELQDHSANLTLLVQRTQQEFVQKMLQISSEQKSIIEKMTDIDDMIEQIKTVM
jgi:hypothetical protein